MMNVPSLTIQEQISAWLQSHASEMCELLERVVNIDSGSRDKQGIDRVNAVFREALGSSGILTKELVLQEYGNCLLAEIPGSSSGASTHALLLGHMDTVFPIGTAAARPYRVEDGVAYGPGVADMKSGLVMNVFVARAFAELGLNRRPIKLLFTGDEEIASPASRQIIKEHARGAHTVLNAEPGRPTGNVITERKGAFFIDFEVRGVAAHSGVAHEKGASAIDALARKIIALHELTDYQKGITTNVGVVSGGMSINTVAPYASAKLDVRFPYGIDQGTLRSDIISIIEEVNVPNTSSRVTADGSFLPLSQSAAGRKLLEDYVTAAAQIGIEVDGEATGGSADSGFTSSVGAPTLCATGPVGGNVHTDKEYCLLETMVPRAQAAALTILAREDARSPQ